MGIFDVLDDLFDDLSGIFGGDDDGGGGDENDGPPPQAMPGMAPVGAPPWGPSWGTSWAPGGAPPWGPAPQVPKGPSGLQQGVDQAGTTYQQASGAVTQTDDKLAGLLKQIFAANDETRSKISAIVNSIETARRALTSNPQMANDPQALALFNQFLDGQLAEIQQVLDSSRVDGQKQAELLAALGDEYRGTAGGAHSKDQGNGGNGGTGSGSGDGGSGDGGGEGGSGGGDGGAGAGAGGTTTGAGAGGGLNDPLAGLGGAGMGDPLSMLGPAMAGLGSIPGVLGGAAGSLPMDALGAMGPLASELAGQGGDGFKDSEAHEHGKSDDFDDGSHGKGDGDGGKNSDAAAGKDDTGDKSDKNASTQPAGTTQPQPTTQPAPASAVPASAGGDPSRVVQMPDGSAVTATTAQHAAAVRAVLSGSTVSDGWKQAHAELPPPGTPVTAPADPSHLLPGQIAQFKSRDPVMYVGNGKIWLDGQLQPQSALPTGDFLGWVDPPQLAGATPAAPSPGSAAPVPTTNTTGS